jgi:hypothetical protein
MTVPEQRQSVELVPGVGTRPLAVVRLSPVELRHPEAVGATVAARLAFEVAPGSADLCALALVLRLDDDRIQVDDLRVVLPGSPTRADSWTMRDGTFGCAVGDPLGVSPVPLIGSLDVVLTVLEDCERLSGQVRVHGTAMRTGLVRRGRAHVAASRLVRFTIDLPDVPVRAAPVASTQPEHGAAVRMCLAVDTEHYSRFGVPEAARAQQRFVALLEGARRYAGLDESAIDLQHSGDGLFAMLPAGVDESVVIPELVEGIRLGLTEVNRDLNERARLRLRVAMHRGHVAPGANGWLGSAVIAVHRLLDSDVLRSALAGAPAADFALVVSDVLYRDVIVDGYRELDPSRFASVVVTSSSKAFSEPAWLYLPSG